MRMGMGNMGIQVMGMGMGMGNMGIRVWGIIRGKAFIILVWEVFDLVSIRIVWIMGFEIIINSWGQNIIGFFDYFSFGIYFLCHTYFAPIVAT